MRGRRTGSWLLGCLILGSSGCLLERTGLDSEAVDAAVRDAGTAEDASMADAGPETDAGPADGGPDAAAAPDAAAPDAATPDAGPPDAGPPDAGPGLEAPGPPEGLAFMGVERSSLTLTWSAPTTGGAPVSYEVQRARNADGVVALVDVGAPAGLAFDDSGLDPGTTYIYRVRAVNAAGAGPYSATAFGTTLTFGPVTRPQFLLVQGTDPNVSWASVPAEGAQLVAVAFHRTNESTPTIDGWNRRVNASRFTGENPHRRQLAVFTRVASAAEPGLVALDWSPNRESSLLVQELDAGGGTWEFVGDSHRATGRSDETRLEIPIDVPADQYVVVGVFGSRDEPGGVDWVGLDGEVGGAGSISTGTAFGVVDHAGGTLTQIVNWTVAREASAAILLFRRLP